MAKKRVLVVVDYQNDFVTGALGFESAKNLDKGISKLMNQYLADENGVVICTFDTHEENYMETQEGRKLPVAHCYKGEAGWELYGEVYNVQQANRDKVICIEKPTFGSLDLAGELRRLNDYPKDREKFNNGEDYTFISNDIESITFVGVVTNMCVISNAVIAKATCPEAEIIIKKDLVGSFDKELHQKALDVMASMQMTIE